MKGKNQMLKATYHVEGKTAADLAEGLKAHLVILSGAMNATLPAPAKKRGRPSNAEKEKAAEESEMEETAEDETEEMETDSDEDEVESEDEDLEETDEVESEDEDSDDEEDADSEPEESEKPKKKASAITLDHLLAGFQKYVKKNGRDAGMKILKKFKVASVRSLKEAQYSQAMTMLSLKK